MVVYTITVQVPPDRMAEAQRAIEERLFEAKLGEAVHPYAQLVLDREIDPVKL